MKNIVKIFLHDISLKGDEEFTGKPLLFLRAADFHGEKRLSPWENLRQEPIPTQTGSYGY